MSDNTVFLLAVSVVLLLTGILIYFIFTSVDNDLSCWQFISSKGPEGKERADIDKLAKVTALIVLTGIIMYETWKGTRTEGMTLIWLGYCGGTAALSAHFRTKQSLAGKEEPESKNVGTRKSVRGKGSGSRRKQVG